MKPDPFDADDFADAERERLDQLVWEFEKAWDESCKTAVSRPDPAKFLARVDPGPLRDAARSELVLIDLEHRLRSGDDARVDDYLERFPDLLADRSTAQELIKTEYRFTLFQGYDPSPDDYAVRFPAACDAALLQTLRELRRDPANDPREPRFRKIRFHREGGPGEVFEAWDRELKRRVALKEIRADLAGDAENQEKFNREAEITGQLEHPNIVSVYHMGRHSDGQPFYAMRFIAGDRKLDDDIADFHRPASPGHDSAARAVALRQLLQRLCDVCNAVAYAHSRGVIHRDLKPNNVLLGPFGETLVADWGLAKVFRDAERALGVADEQRGLKPLRAHESPATLPGSQLGTPAYMSPEQADGQTGQLGPASDVYSLGAMLYHLLTGRAPFSNPRTEAEVVEVLRQVKAGQFQPPRQANPAIARPMEAICLKAMAHDPRDRFATPRELVDDIEHWLADEPVRSYPDSSFERLTRWARRHRTWAQAGAGSLLLITLISIGSALLVNQARRQAEQRSADLAWDQGLTLCEQGDAGRGVLWMARSLQISGSKGGDPRRASLAGWCRKLCVPKGYFTIPGGAGPLALGPASLTLITGGSAKPAQLWKPETETHMDLRPPQGAGINAAAFSPDGQSVVTTRPDGTAQVWNAATAEMIGLPLVHPGPFTILAWGPRGNVVMTASDQSARLWDAATGKGLSLVLTHPSPVVAAAFSADGTSVLTAAGAVAQLWDTSTGNRIGPPLTHPQTITAAALSPDGKTVATGCEDRAARLWKMPAGERLGDALAQEGIITLAAFSPKGATVLSGNDFGTAYLSEASTGARIGSPLVHHRPLYAAAFSADGRSILTGSADKTARLWDAATGRPTSSPLLHPAAVTMVGFGSDGQTLVTASDDGTVRLWEAPPLETILRHPSHVNAVAFSPDGSSVLTGCGDLADPSADAQGQLWDAASGEAIGRPLPHQQAVSAVAFNPLRKTVLTVAGNIGRLWDATTGQLLLPTMTHDSFIHAAAFDQSGNQIATGSSDRTAKIWDTATRQCRYQLAHDGQVLAVTFSADGRSLVTAADRRAQLWDAAAGTRMGPSLLHDAAVRAVALSGDGKTILTGAGSKAQLWDRVTFQPIGRPMPHQGPVAAAAFSSDGRMVLTGSEDGTARLWDGTNGAPVGRPLSHRKEVWAVAFNFDGGMASTASEDGTARVWETASGKSIGPPLVHEWTVRKLAISPSGRTVVTAGGADNTARLWVVPPPLSVDVPWIVEWIQVIAGREMDADGVFPLMDARTWQAHRESLRRMGGRPNP
jgi:WD40 repeat protein/serine/threonine protein kinase